MTHGWAQVLTVMSPQGNQAVLEALAVGDDAIIYSGPKRLVQIHEKRAGVLDELIRCYRIQVLNKAEWDAKKAALGSAIWLS